MDWYPPGGACTIGHNFGYGTHTWLPSLGPPNGAQWALVMPTPVCLWLTLDPVAYFHQVIVSLPQLMHTWTWFLAISCRSSGVLWAWWSSRMAFVAYLPQPVSHSQSSIETVLAGWWRYPPDPCRIYTIQVTPSYCRGVLRSVYWVGGHIMAQ